MQPEQEIHVEKINARNTSTLATIDEGMSELDDVGNIDKTGDEVVGPGSSDPGGEKGIIHEEGGILPPHG